MSKSHIFHLLIAFLFVFIFVLAGTASAASISFQTATPTPSSIPLLYIATQEELLIARTEWGLSAHSNTFDDGLGANTTCARCKSPMNWDPSQQLAAQQALDCGSCKRIPGAPRPELESGTPVLQDEWHNIQCNICHIPVGNSYYTSVAFWDQASRSYIPVQNASEICAKCHEGQHGFNVIEEQTVSKGHSAWECTRCHGSHGRSSACTDCHDSTASAGASEHLRHPSVNCTACHDQGNLSIWLDTNPNSKHLDQYITRRFAHTLTSWPSHDLSRQVKCVRCHHPPNRETPVLAPSVSCVQCHPDGASLFWCTNFPRDPNPSPTETPLKP